MTKHLFENLAKLEAKKKGIEIEIELARHAVIIEMQKENVDTAKVNEIGTFTITVSKKWTYSDEVKVAEGNIKNLKKVEQETGIAKAEETPSLRFTPKKDDTSNDDTEHQVDNNISSGEQARA